jgi:hypothetical protein
MSPAEVERKFRGYVGKCRPKVAPTPYFAIFGQSIARRIVDRPRARV